MHSSMNVQNTSYIWYKASIDSANGKRNGQYFFTKWHNFRRVKIKSLFKPQNQRDGKNWILQMLGEKKKMLITSIFFSSYNVFKSLFHHSWKNLELYSKG